LKILLIKNLQKKRNNKKTGLKSDMKKLNENEFYKKIITNKKNTIKIIRIKLERLKKS
jgi:hypothetical protein